MNREVKSWRKAEFSLPQPTRISVSMAASSSFWAAVRRACSDPACSRRRGHPLGVAHRVGDGDRTPLGDPEQREPRDPRGVDYRLQIAHEGVERDLVGGPVRQPVAAGVVPDELMVLRQLPIRCRQMGLSRSNSRWVIQLPVFINGGPWPIIE